MNLENYFGIGRTIRDRAARARTPSGPLVMFCVTTHHNIGTTEYDRGNKLRAWDDYAGVGNRVILAPRVCVLCCAGSIVVVELQTLLAAVT
jgi:hypothetical protein